jgi:fucose permease
VRGLVAAVGRALRSAHEATIGLFAAVVAAAEVIGLVIVERMLARGASPRRLLAVSSSMCAIACATWWIVPGTIGPLLLFALLGFAAAPLYPIAAARAYAMVPGRAALVAAASQAFVVVDLVAPWALGVTADTFGLPAALVVIATGPLVLLGFAAWPARWRDSTTGCAP